MCLRWIYNAVESAGYFEQFDLIRKVETDDENSETGRNFTDIQYFFNSIHISYGVYFDNPQFEDIDHYCITLDNQGIPKHIECKYGYNGYSTKGKKLIPLLRGKPHGLCLHHDTLTSGTPYRYFICYLKYYQHGTLLWETMAGNTDRDWCRFTVPKQSKDYSICQACEHCLGIMDHHYLNDMAIVQCKHLCWYYPKEYWHDKPIFDFQYCPKVAEHESVLAVKDELYTNVQQEVSWDEEESNATVRVFDRAIAMTDKP